MSGNMYQSRWQSDFEDVSVADTSSQYSDAPGSIKDRSPDVAQRMHSLFRDQVFTDVKFVVSCGVKPKPVLFAHKAILAIGSVKFQEMLYGGDSVKDIGRSQQTEIQINNISFDSFKTIVEYLYTDDVFFENDDSVMETLNAARLFEIQPLVDRCEAYFESAEITEDGVCSKFQLANSHSMEKLKKNCSQFIQENTRSVIRSADFKSSSTSTVRSICKLPKLNLRSEMELFEAIIAWAEVHARKDQSKRTVVEPLLRHIRFLGMPCKEFSQLVQKCPDIFTAEEALNIVMYLSNPVAHKNASGLPPWCNKGANRCSNTGRADPVQDGHSRSPDQQLTIALRPIRKGFSNNLMCLLELKCVRPNTHLIKGLKLSFGEPVTELSSIEHLIVSVNMHGNYSNYNFKENIKIHNSKEVVLNFSKTLLVSLGNTLCIRAEANEVRNYKFLQFDEANSFSDSPFECNLVSVPKENRLFFISEVIYAVLPRNRSRGNNRGRGDYRSRGFSARR